MDELEEVLSQEEAPYELQDSNVPPDQRPTLRKLLDEGVWVYGEILERLAPYISFRRRRRPRGRPDSRSRRSAGARSASGSWPSSSRCPPPRTCSRPRPS